MDSLNLKIYYLKLSSKDIAIFFISKYFHILCFVCVSFICFVHHQITKVMLGAHGFLSNGYVMGSVGTAMVAMAAKSRGVPVIVCCEAYKFCDRVQTDSIVNNEIGQFCALKVSNHG